VAVFRAIEMNRQLHFVRPFSKQLTEGQQWARPAVAQGGERSLIAFSG
jgi:hypothetical protein